MASVALSEAEKVYIVHGVQVAPSAASASAAGFPGPAGCYRPSILPRGGGWAAEGWVYLVTK